MLTSKSVVSRMLGSSSSTGGASSAPSVRDPVDDIGGIVRSGYLVKLATKSKLNWKKRFFVLHENNLKYFTDHISTTGTCKGEFVISSTTVISDVDRSIGKDHCLRLKSADDTDELIISARDLNDKRAWKEAIETAIHRTKNSTRGYAMKLDQFDDKPVRRYFILHDKILTYHQDEEHTGAIQGMFELSENTKVQVSEEMYALSLTDAEKNRIILQFDASTQDFSRWKSSILAVTGRVQMQASQSDDARIQKALANAIKQGPLKVRPPSRNIDTWEERYFILTGSELIQIYKLPENGTGGRIVESFRVHPSCSVFETNLGAFAFELVTSEKVLHVIGDSKETTNSWMIALRDAIFHSQPEPDDPLLQAALKKIETDVFYEVTFREDKPLGVVLERTGEWAVVKLSNFKDTGVHIGSALVSVNDIDVTLLTYSATIEKLKNWKPPLKLGFRKAPSKQGYLTKQARSNNRSGMKKSWTQRFFTLDEGRLMYKENDAADVTLKGDFPLMGSAVSLVSEEETGRPYCFRLVSGVTCLIMNASSAEDMMDWASTLYHAIAIANGGAHLIAIERERVHKEQTAEAQRQKEAEEKALAERLEAEAAKAEEERLAAEALRQEEERLALEEASIRLSAAMEARDLEALRAAIDAMDALALPDGPMLSDARELLKVLEEERDAEVLSKELAENQLDAEVNLADTAELTDEYLHQLSHAIENAKRAGVDHEKLDGAMTRMMSLRQRKQRRDELVRMLKFAVMYKSLAGLREAICAADEEGYSDLSVLDEARELLNRLTEEQAAMKAAEDERLAKEAADLDASLNEETAPEDDEDDKVEVEEDVNSKVPFRRTSMPYGKRVSIAEDGSKTPGKVTFTRQPSNKYTIAANLSKHPSGRFILGQEPDEDMDLEGLPSIDSIRNEDIQKVFHAFARRSSTGTMNPKQFSTIWRMLTGDKGNLFQEMALFHKFDAGNNGALSDEEFIKGWRDVASQPGGERLLRKIKTLAGDDNVIL